jgi:hypothetical protein
VSLSDKFVSAVKIAAQSLPVTAALSQWLDEIDAGKIKARLARLEDPLANHGPRAKELTKVLYSLIQAQPQNHPTDHFDRVPQLEPFIKELRHFEACGFLTGSHAMGPGGVFAAGFRFNNAPFIILLALTFDDPEENARLAEIIDGTETPLDGVELRKSVNLPLLVIDAYFDGYAARGQGNKSEENGKPVYLPNAR